jgi:hypothetical protein
MACLTLACCVRPSSAAILLSSHSSSSSSSPASADSSAVTTLVGSLHTTTTGVVVSDSNSDVGGGEGGQAEESAAVARGVGGDYAGGQGLHDCTRRRRGVISAAALAMLSAFCSNCPSSHAFSLGISGPKEWLKGQKQKTAKFLFAPINASRDRLDSALLLLCEYRWTLN